MVGWGRSRASTKKQTHSSESTIKFRIRRRTRSLSARNRLSIVGPVVDVAFIFALTHILAWVYIRISECAGRRHGKVASAGNRAREVRGSRTRGTFRLWLRLEGIRRRSNWLYQGGPRGSWRRQPRSWLW